jgi:5-hydroxyisourate hydrolase-like protein (transthyretin family)
MATQSPSTTRIDRRWINTAFFLLIVLVVVAGFAALWWVTTLPWRVDEQQTIVVGRTRFAPDSEGSVRVVVQDFGRGEPIAGAQVLVSLKPEAGRAIPLYEGETDATGSVPVSFHVPADAPAEATLVVETRSSVGRDVVEQPVAVEREYRLLLTSDKPLYQPGQVIHMRALALSTFDLTPARGATVDFLVEDPKGNKVFRQSVEASDFGIAAADFTLADLVNQGSYKLSVAIGDTAESQTRSEKTVEVRPYVLPKFGVSVSTDRSFYLPGQRVEGVVQADYFFGKPVADSEVRVVGSVWDVERTVVVDLQGQTDENGTYEFGFDLPEYFAGSGLDSGQAQFALEVTVIDQTDHPEQTSTVLPVAAQPLIIEAVAESGVLKPGVKNIVYILTAYPDGRPAETQLQVNVDGGEPVELASGEFGLAEFTFTPQANSAPWLHIVAQDEIGLEASRDVSFETEYGSDSVLLRADRAAYVVGETMNLTALTPVEAGSIYLDIVRTGQTLSTRSAQVESGGDRGRIAEFAVDVSPDMYGTLELHAYKVLLDGTIVRDTRVVVVDAPNDVDIAISADKDTYLPGEMATVDFQTTGEGGGVQTALGVAIVDESVFALQRQDPGFAKLYFMLEQELIEPFYQVKGFELPAAIPPAEEEVRLAQDEAAKATWAGVSAASAQPINSRYEKLSVVDEAQSAGFTRISQGAVIGMILVPLGLWAVAIVALVRSGVVKRTLVRLAIAFGIVVVGSCLLSGWLFALMNEFYYFDFEVLLIPLGLIFGAGVLGVGIYAWVKRDPAAKFFTLLTLAWPALLLLLFLASGQGGEPSEALTVVALVALALVPGVYLLFGQMRWAQKRRVVGGIATGLGALLALLVMVVLFAGLLAFSPAPMMAGLPAPEMADGEWGVEEGEAVRQVEKEMEAPPGAPTPIPDTAGGDESAVEGKEAPRLRQYFPETLYWAPEVVTDAGGFASLEIPMADSITTWRLTALASSQDGRLGFTTQGVRVFQDFFVDIDLPVSLTQGDEISIPVGVFNYLPEAQEVRLEVEEEDWFELLGEGEQTLTIASNDIEVVYFPIRVLDFGRHGFQVTAWGEQMRASPSTDLAGDAIRREVAVVPDGKEFRLTESDWLREDKEIALEIPAEAVPDTPYVEVKVYPGVMAQAVEGLEKILRLPHG